MKIYVASSWRNPHQQSVVAALREDGHDVYDFRNPSDGDHGFSWSEISTRWKEWPAEEYIAHSERRGWEPELMYKIHDLVTPSLNELRDWLRILDLSEAVGGDEFVFIR